VSDQELLVRKLVILVAVAVSAVAAVSPGGSSVSSSFARSSDASYQLLQMNLCLSGQAGCYSRTTYSSILDEATGQIAELEPDAVTLNEVCSADTAAIARQTGYRMRFAAVRYGGRPLPCLHPRGRGLFGIAVLTKDAFKTSRDRAFAVRADPEERRWLCVTNEGASTEGAVTVCTAHLSTRDSADGRVANDAECRELRSVLARHQKTGTTLFGGDVNRQDPCAPTAMWATRDTSATHMPGVQHIYGTMPCKEWSASVAEGTYTDHDFFLATATTTPSG
jgi:endonuclease/exonuclease/phosphatase family metal-dependent hydrolase